MSDALNWYFVTYPLRLEMKLTREHELHSESMSNFLFSFNRYHSLLIKTLSSVRSLI